MKKLLLLLAVVVLLLLLVAVGRALTLDSPQAAERWCEVVARAVATGRISPDAGRTLARRVREFWRGSRVPGMSGTPRLATMAP